VAVPAACLVTFAAIGLLFDRPLVEERREVDHRLTPEDEARALETVRLFNAVYQDFYASGGDPALIDEFPASKMVRHYTFRDLGYLRESELVQVYDLANLAIVETRSDGPGRAVVRTREDWNYVYQRSSDRSPASEMKGMTAEFRYRLEAREAGWVIVAWDPE